MKGERRILYAEMCATLRRSIENNEQIEATTSNDWDDSSMKRGDRNATWQSLTNSGRNWIGTKI